jgi:hypothetical protein
MLTSSAGFATSFFRAAVTIVSLSSHDRTRNYTRYDKQTLSSASDLDPNLLYIFGKSKRRMSSGSPIYSTSIQLFYPPLSFFENKLIILRQIDKELNAPGDPEFHVALGTKETINKWQV